MSLERRVEYVDGEEDESIYLDAMWRDKTKVIGNIKA
jgi:hypothetical protein